jgi:hypothetical protein
MVQQTRALGFCSRPFVVSGHVLLPCGRQMNVRAWNDPDILNTWYKSPATIRYNLPPQLTVSSKKTANKRCNRLKQDQYQGIRSGGPTCCACPNIQFRCMPEPKALPCANKYPTGSPPLLHSMRFGPILPSVTGKFGVPSTEK